MSAFAGQTIRLQWWFDAVDAISNDGQGVFVDDLAVQTFCEPIETCVFNEECDDGDSCTADTCIAGACVSNEIQGCCSTDAQCDDNYVCTTDVCTNGTCTYTALTGCCQFAVECNDSNPCTNDLCIANQCAYQPNTAESGCCVLPSDCDDGDACTVEACVDSTCQYTASATPGCCTADSLLDVNFDDGSIANFAFIGGGTAANWSLQAKRFFSPPLSLYFGIPGEWTYVTDPASSGVAISPEITVPITAAAATLTFTTWVDITSLGFLNDTYDVRVLSGATLKTVWSYADSPTPADWITVSVDLSEYIGETIRLYWNFQSQDVATSSFGEGVYVDDISVITSCAP